MSGRCGKGFCGCALLTVSLALTLAAARPAAAAMVAYALSATGTGNQSFDGRFGMDFTVLQPIKVIGLGAFDNGGNGILNSVPASHVVEISLWQQTSSTTGTRLTSLDFGGSSDPLVAGYRFHDLATPLVLSAGTYTIAAAFYGTEQLANDNSGGFVDPGRTLNDGGGALTFGLARYTVGNGASDYPNTPGPFLSAEPSNQQYMFFGPSFSFDLVPEPSTLLLVGLGAGLLCRRGAHSPK